MADDLPLHRTLSPQDWAALTDAARQRAHALRQARLDAMLDRARARLAAALRRPRAGPSERPASAA